MHITSRLCESMATDFHNVCHKQKLLLHTFQLQLLMPLLLMPIAALGQPACHLSDAAEHGAQTHQNRAPRSPQFGCYTK
jgi:hypothetical protein